MSVIDSDIIERIKSESDLVAYIGREVKLRKAGVRWNGLCPFHQERTPSFYVIPSINRYHCFGCGEKGDILDYVRKKTGLSLKDCIDMLASELGIQQQEFKKDILPPRRFSKMVKTKEIRVDEKRKWISRQDSTEYLVNHRGPKEFVEWFGGKGIQDSTIYDLALKRRIGMINETQLAFFFPTGVKVRREFQDSHSSYWAEGFPEAPWLSEDLINPAKRVVYLAEGESDAMRLYGLMDGHECVISIPSASWTPSPEMCYKIGAFRTVILCFDGDEAGRNATTRIGGLLKKHAHQAVIKDAQIPKDQDICTLTERKLENLLDRLRAA